MKFGKITRKSYDDACAAAHGMDLIGERWSIFVMRELMTGPKRFTQLRGELSGISANVLTQRLTFLEKAGVVERQRLPPPASVNVYALTDWGLEAEPILKELGRWASRSPAHDPTLPFSNASLVLSLRTMFSAARAGKGRAVIRLLLGEEAFLARVRGGSLTIEADRGEAADAIMKGSAHGVAGIIYNSASPEAAGVSIEGDSERAMWFTTLFPLPDKVDAKGTT